MRPKSSLGFGTSQPRFRAKGDATKREAGGTSFASRMDAEKAKIDAEKAKMINTHMKVFQEAIKAALDLADEEVFCENLDANYHVRDAKNDLKFHSLFHKLTRMATGMDSNFIVKNQFRTLVQSFTKVLSDSQCNEVFAFLTKRTDSKSNSRLDENADLGNGRGGNLEVKVGANFNKLKRDGGRDRSNSTLQN